MCWCAVFASAVTLWVCSVESRVQLKRQREIIANVEVSNSFEHESERFPRENKLVMRRGCCESKDNRLWLNREYYAMFRKNDVTRERVARASILESISTNNVSIFSSDYRRHSQIVTREQSGPTFSTVNIPTRTFATSLRFQVSLLCLRSRWSKTMNRNRNSRNQQQ